MSRQFVLTLTTVVVCLAVHAALRLQIENSHDVLGNHRWGQALDPNLIRDFNQTDLSRRYSWTLPSSLLKRFTFGYTVAAADLQWLRFIQAHDVLVVDRPMKGWLYQILDNTVTLDPKFYMAYVAGGTWLSVVRRDIEGAADLLERGYQVYPEDRRLLLQLLYHHIYETENKERAAELAKKIAVLPGAPPYFARLAATLLSKIGAVDESVTFLEQMIATAENPAIQKNYEEKLADLKRHPRKQPHTYLDQGADTPLR